MSSNSIHQAASWREKLSDGRAWVWLVDGVGFLLFVCLLSTAGFKLVGMWLLPCLLVAAVVGVVLGRVPAGERPAEDCGDDLDDDEAVRIVTVTICPRPIEARHGET